MPATRLRWSRSCLRQPPPRPACPETGGRHERNTHPDLLSDLFASYYKAVPTFRPADQCDPESQWNRQVLSRQLEGAEHRAVRTATMLDDLASAIAARAAGEALLKERIAAPAAPPPPRLRRGSEVRAPSAAPAQTVQPAAAAEDQGAEAPEGAVDPAVPDPKEVRQAARAAREAAQKAVDQAEDAFAGWGIGPGELQYLPLSGRLDLAERLVNDPRLRSFAAVLGRLRNLANARWRRRLVPRPQKLVGVTLGRDLALAVPNEVAALRDPRLKYDAIYRWSQGRLLQWDRRGRQRLGRGPMIVCCDTSGSTQGAKDWIIKALALGLLEIAWKQRRAFAGVVFSGRGQIDVTEFQPGKRDVERLLHFATAWFGDLTDFETPLGEAMKLQRHSPYAKADIVFLTDGLAPMGEAFLRGFLAEKRARDVRVLCVLADTGAYARGTVGAFADEVVQATDFESIAAEIFDWAAVER